MFIRYIIIFFSLFSTKSFVLSKEYCNFAMWIERTCKPFDKGKLTTLPHFNICQQNLFNVSIMLKYKDLPKVNSERWLLLDDFEGEVWKDVVGYEGLYQVSNYGRLKSLTRRCRIPSNKFISVPCERILVSDIINGYCKIHICKNGKAHKTSIHRIEMLAFTPNPNNKPCVDHIDGNRGNNCLYNLRWSTVKENMNNVVTTSKISKNRTGRPMPQETKNKIARTNTGKTMGSKNGKSKPVIQLSLNGDIIKVWTCAREAERTKGFDRSCISKCCLNKAKQYKGYMWRFLET